MKILDGEYTLRKFRSGDEDGVLKLWQESFHTSMPRDLFKWKLLQNPYGNATMLCINSESKIVTFYGGITFAFNCDGKQINALHAMDIMSHPDYRSDKIFASTAGQFFNEYSATKKADHGATGKVLFGYGFTGQLHYSIGKQIFHYHKLNKIEYLAADIAGLKKIVNHHKTKADYSIELVDALDEKSSIGFDLLWEKCKQDYPLSIIRNFEFVKWRYFDHPKKTYTVLKLINLSDNSMEAYVVLAFKKAKAIIVDVLIPDSDDLFSKFVQCLSEFLFLKNIEEIETWLPENHFISKYALLNGFTAKTEPLGIIPTIQLTNQSPTLEWVRTNFYYNMGDGDLF